MHLNHLLASLALALPALASTSNLGCYSTVPGLKASEQYTFQSQGYCEDKCQKAGYRVAALSSGSACACGNELPKASDKVDHAECDLPCTGYPAVKCGGKSAYTVLSIGEHADVSNDGSSTATATGDIVVAPTNINPSSVPTGILTAPGSGGYKGNGNSTTTASTSAGSSAAATSASTSSSASPTPNAAEGLRAGSSVLGAFVAGLGLLL